MMTVRMECGIIELASDAGRAITYCKMGIVDENTKDMLGSGLKLFEKLLEGSQFYDKTKVKFAFLSPSTAFKDVVDLSQKEKEYVISTVGEVKEAFQKLYEGNDVENLSDIQAKLLEIINPIVLANVTINPGKV